jgi:hypothetical protein
MRHPPSRGQLVRETLPATHRLEQGVSVRQGKLIEGDTPDDEMNLVEVMVGGVQAGLACEIGEPAGPSLLERGGVRHAELREGSRSSISACGTVAAGHL